MPASDTVSNRAAQPKKKVKRAKPATRKVTVAPADRTVERADRRQQQLKKSVRKAGDAPQDRARDTERGQTYVKKQYAAEKKKGIVRADAKGGEVKYRPGTTVPPDVAQKVVVRKARAVQKAQTVARVAPVLKVLDQTTRPLHAVAAGTDAAVQGRNVPKAALKGLKNEDKTTFSTVLEHAGVKNKYVKGGLGFVLDVGLDPTTYVTGGTASVLRKGALKAGEKEAAKGVTVKVAGKEVPGIRKATAKAGEGGGKAFRKVVPEKVRDATRNAASEVNPNVAPAGVAKETHQAARRVARKARAAQTKGEREAINLGRGIKSRIGEKNYNRVVDAIESEAHKAEDIPAVRKQAADLRQVAKGAEANAARQHASGKYAFGQANAVHMERLAKKSHAEAQKLENHANRAAFHRSAETVADLPPELRGHAETVRRHLAEIRQVQKSAGLKAPERKGYVPRKLTEKTLKAEQKASTRTGTRTVELKSSKARKEQRPLAEVRQTDPGRYREDLHALVAERMAEGTSAAARANLAKDVADLGHEIPRGSRPRLSEREAVYKLKDGKLAEVDVNSKAFQKKPPKTKPLKAKYVVLNKSLVDRTMGSVAPAKGGTILHGYDRAQSGFKRVALATPGFHIRNVIGDTSQAYVHQPGQKLPGNMVRAGRVLKAQGRIEKAQQALKPADSTISHARDIQRRPIKRTRLQAQRLLRQRDLGRGEYPELGKAAALEKHTGKPNSISVERSEFEGNKYGPASHSTVYRYFDANGRNVGWARLHSNGGRSVYVDPAARRQGIATKLYKRAEQDGFDIRNPGGGNTQTELGDVLNRSMGRSSGGSFKTGKYGHVTYEEAARKLVGAGAARSGYTSRELRELASSGEKKLKLPKSPGAVRRAFLNREDLPRLATAIHAVREGATWEEAAAKVADVHFDYADLTPFERNVARRIMPFYTWTARNVPLQAKSIVSKPGKYAAFQKVRENAAQLSQPGEVDEKTKGLYKQLEAAGVKMRGGWEKYLTQYEQRNAGVPISWKGHKFTLSAGLPLQDLNELPGVSGPGEYLNKAASLVTPLVKDPVEFGFNYSFFFRDQIERDNSPLVAAPSPVGKWPEWAKKKFGVVKAVDKRSGKMIWQWPGKADYVAHAVPGLPSQAVKMMTPGHDRQGKGTVAKALGVAGIKATPLDPVTNAINMAYARGQEIQKQQGILRKQNNPKNGELIGAKNPTPEYTRLALQLRTVNQIAYAGSAKRGDKVLPKQGGPKKYKVRKGGFDFTGGQKDFDFSGGGQSFDFG